MNNASKEAGRCSASGAGLAGETTCKKDGQFGL